MSPSDVLERLDDRFRLLAAARRGEARHQTLRQAVAWSYDLLDDIERAVLGRCAIFAGGFDLAAATHLCGDMVLDDYEALDRLDGLVRKSLLTMERTGSRTRYGMLETIRQFAEERVATHGIADDLRDRHAAYFGERSVAFWEVWQGPDQRLALDWFDAELANLRAAFHWAAPWDPVVAVTVAAHSAMLGLALERFEPVAWAEELASADLHVAEVRQLPRLYTAASLCTFVGRAKDSIGYARRAITLETDPCADPFPDGLTSFCLASAHVHAGQPELALELYTELVTRSGAASVYGRSGRVLLLVAVGRNDEARSLADDALAAARALDNPFFVGFALYGYGVALGSHDPPRARKAFDQGLAYTSRNRQVMMEGSIARDAARFEDTHGDLARALELYELALDIQHRSGSLAHLVPTLTCLVVSFDRIGRWEAAATLYGATIHWRTSYVVPPSKVEHLRTVLGDDVFDRCFAEGATMEPAEAAHYARQQIDHARAEVAASHPRRPS